MKHNYIVIKNKTTMKDDLILRHPLRSIEMKEQAAQRKQVNVRLRKELRGHVTYDETVCPMTCHRYRSVHANHKNQLHLLAFLPALNTYELSLF